MMMYTFFMCQIADVLAEAGAPCGINSVCLYGGTSKGPQISALKSGVVRALLLLLLPQIDKIFRSL